MSNAANTAITAEEKAKIIEKIKKCYARSVDRGASDAEAEIAMRQAARLKAMYQIDDAQINAAAGNRTIRLARANARHMCSPGSTGKALPFTGIISIGVARMTGTIVTHMSGISIHTGTLNEFYQFSGEITDVKLAVWLQEVLCANALREWKSAVTDEPKMKWLKGWAGAVQKRLFKMAEIEAEEEGAIKASDSNALVVLNRKDAMVAEKFGEQKFTKSKGEAGVDGWQAGMATNIPAGGIGSTEQQKLSA